MAFQHHEMYETGEINLEYCKFSVNSQNRFTDGICYTSLRAG